MANGVKEPRWLTVIFCLYFLLAVGYSLLMPIWEAPDEGAHFHLAWYLARKDQYATEEKNYEAAQPSNGFPASKTQACRVVSEHREEEFLP